MRQLDEITAEIRRLDRSSAESVWEIGKLLSEVKSDLPHGQYTQWVLSELSFSASYAARLVRLYEEYSDGLPAGFAISTLLCTLPLEEALRENVNHVIRLADLTKTEAERLKAEAVKDEARIAELRSRLEQSTKADREILREQLREELRAEFEASKPAKKAKDNSDADLEQLRADLQSMRESYEVKLAQQEEEADRLKKAAVAAQQVEARARAEAEALRAKLATAKSTATPVEVRVEVPPDDYDELKQLAAEVPTLRAAVHTLESRARSREVGSVDEWRGYADYLRDQCAGHVLSFAEWLVHEETVQ